MLAFQPYARRLSEMLQAEQPNNSAQLRALHGQLEAAYTQQQSDAVSGSMQRVGWLVVPS